jgi:hypothetical protein
LKQLVKDGLCRLEIDDKSSAADLITKLTLQNQRIALEGEEGEVKFLEGYRNQYANLYPTSCNGPLALIDVYPNIVYPLKNNNLLLAWHNLQSRTA